MYCIRFYAFIVKFFTIVHKHINILDRDFMLIG